MAETSLNEAETRPEPIDPALNEAGWGVNPNRPLPEAFDRLADIRQAVTR